MLIAYMRIFRRAEYRPNFSNFTIDLIFFLGCEFANQGRRKLDSSPS